MGNIKIVVSLTGWTSEEVTVDLSSTTHTLVLKRIFFAFNFFYMHANLITLLN